jgi:glucokinase
MIERVHIGIDIGATKANLGLVTEVGDVLDSLRIPVRSDISAGSFIQTLSQHVERLLSSNELKKEQIAFYGAGVPGTADVSTGMVEYCPNLGWQDVPASDLFKEYLGVEVKVAQDSRLAAWAEYLLGAGIGYQTIICVTLGTGIGSGIIIDGKIYYGALNTAGELGHTVFRKDGRPCSCGNRGCLERYCSGTGIIERALELFPDKFTTLPHKSESVFELAYRGDQEVLSFIRGVVEDLAVGIANAVSLISPEAVIISGGLCEHESLIIEPLRELVNHYGYYSWVRKYRLRIEKARLGSEAPMIGAALLNRSL